MNSLSRKHFLRLALAVAAVAAAGSAPNVFAAGDVVEITVPHPYGKIFRPIHQKIIKEFNKIHPNVKVRLETPFPDYEELTQRTLAGIAQGNAPVLSFQGINQIRQYIEMGAAYDLSEFVKNDPRWKDGSGYHPPMMEHRQLVTRQRLLSHDDETRQFQRQAVRGAVCYLDADCLLQRNAA